MGEWQARVKEYAYKFLSIIIILRIESNHGNSIEQLCYTLKIKLTIVYIQDCDMMHSVDQIRCGWSCIMLL